MSKKKTQDEVIENFKKIHGDKYDYSLVEYIRWDKKVKILCSLHGEFIQTPNGHLCGRGCWKCSGEANGDKLKMTKEEFLSRSNTKHGNIYDYSKVEYIKSNKKLEIICKTHGKFKQTANAHLTGCGCAGCAASRSRENSNGWTYTSWQKAGETSKDFDSYKVYVIKIKSMDNTEEFYKIGKTFLTLKKRFNILKRISYTWEVVDYCIFNSAREASEKEDELKRANKIYSYMPNMEFGGRYECFNLNLPISKTFING